MQLKWDMSIKYSKSAKMEPNSNKNPYEFNPYFTLIPPSFYPYSGVYGKQFTSSEFYPYQNLKVKICYHFRNSLSRIDYAQFNTSLRFLPGPDLILIRMLMSP